MEAQKDTASEASVFNAPFKKMRVDQIAAQENEDIPQKLSKRGIIKEFTPRSQKRLEIELSQFQSSTGTGTQSKDYALTLTSFSIEAKEGRKDLKKWIDWMRKNYSFCGIYVLEFQDNGQVHYHLSLRIFGNHNQTKLTKDILTRWKHYNPLVSASANFLKQIWDIDGWNDYLLKKDSPKKIQKIMRGTIEAIGLGSRWWGSINKSLYHQNQESLPLAG